MSATTSTRAAAVIYAARGWAVFPCHAPAPGPGGCSCGEATCASPAKHPRVRGGLHAASTDERDVARWWRRWPDANVAIRTGAESGLVVLDVDPRHDGHRTLDRLLSEHGPLPEARTVATGGGGFHVYFAHPGGAVRNDAGRRVGPGLDVRGDGGYVIACPSVHASGDRYQLRSGGSLTPDLPGWLTARLEAPPPSPPPTPGRPVAVRDVSAWARAALDGELQRLRAAPEGTRNDTLNRVAFRLGQIVGGGALDEATATAVLVEGGTAVGLAEHETTATVRSGLRAGLEHPRRPRPAPAMWDGALHASRGGSPSAAL